MLPDFHFLDFIILKIKLIFKGLPNTYSFAAVLILMPFKHRFRRELYPETLEV